MRKSDTVVVGIYSNLIPLFSACSRCVFGFAVRNPIFRECNRRLVSKNGHGSGRQVSKPNVFGFGDVATVACQLDDHEIQ
jgi:hypothetical protein